MAYLLAALFGGFFLFNSLATPKKVAGAIESALAKRFPGSQIRADVQGKRGRDVLKGRFRSARIEMSRFDAQTQGGFPVQIVPSAKDIGQIGRLEVVLRDFRLQNFQVERAELSLDNLRVDWKALRKDSQLKLVSLLDASAPRTAGRVRLVLGQDALQAWVRQKYPDIQGATVTLSGDREIRVRGTRAVMGAALPFVLVGRIGLRDGRILEVSNPQVTAGAAPLPAPLSAPFTRGLSSIYELDPQGSWPLAVSDANVKIEAASGAPSLVLEAAIALKPAPSLEPQQ